MGKSVDEFILMSPFRTRSTAELVHQKNLDCNKLTSTLAAWKRELVHLEISCVIN